jgi:hypothetical protein
MAKPRAANRRTSRFGDDPDKIEAAIRLVNERLLDLGVKPGLSDDERNAVFRAQTEIREMFSRVRREVKENKRGWTWHLLNVLEWGSNEIWDNESEGLRLRLALEDDRSPGEVAREWKARRRRLRSAMKSYQAALPDLEWAARRVRVLTGETFRDDVLRGGRALLLAIDEVDNTDRGVKVVSSIHAKRRGYRHVHAAAMRMLIQLHGMAGKNEQSALAAFIDDTNDEMRPQPCPRFARDVTHDKVRKALSEWKL